MMAEPTRQEMNEAIAKACGLIHRSNANDKIGTIGVEKPPLRAIRYLNYFTDAGACFEVCELLDIETDINTGRNGATARVRYANDNGEPEYPWTPFRAGYTAAEALAVALYMAVMETRK